MLQIVVGERLQAQLMTSPINIALTIGLRSYTVYVSFSLIEIFIWACS